MPCCANHHALQQLAQAYARHLSVRHNRKFKATVTSNGKISVKDDLEDGMFALLSAEFVQTIVMQRLPVVEMDKLQAVAA